MQIPRIYLPQTLIAGTTVTLDPGATKHVRRVLRLKPGAALILFNGAGCAYRSMIERIDRESVRVAIGAPQSTELESPLQLTLALGVLRGERMDYAIQKAAELGVTRIIPLVTERCVIRLDAARSEKRTHHWRSIVASACEQCGRNRLPDVAPLRGLRDWLGEAGGSLRLVFHPGDGARLAELEQASGQVRMLIGPEGGFSPEEIQAVRDAGFRCIRMGPRTLRAETAAIAAIAALQCLWGDLC
jgi:RNA methyltransferase, RsmE family